MSRKKVHFNQSIEYIAISPVCQTTKNEQRSLEDEEEEKKQQWWLVEEMERLRLEARMSCLAAAQQENHDVVLAKGLGEALRVAKHKIGPKLFHPSSGRYMYSVSSDTGQNLQNIDVNVSVALWSQHCQSHRGLEMTASSVYQKVVRKSHRSRIQSVLQLYKTGASDAQICKASEVQSLPLRIFAHQMGMADALVASCCCCCCCQQLAESGVMVDGAYIQHDVESRMAAISAAAMAPELSQQQMSTSWNDNISQHHHGIQGHECHCNNSNANSRSGGILSDGNNADNNIHHNSSTATTCCTACTVPNLLDMASLVPWTLPKDDHQNKSNWKTSLSSLSSSSSSSITTTTTTSSSLTLSSSVSPSKG